MLSIPGTLTLLKQVRDGKYSQMEADVRVLKLALAEAQAESATVGKKLAALQVREAIQAGEMDGVVNIAYTLTAQLRAQGIQPAQDIDAFLRYSNKKEQHRAEQ